MTENKNIKCIFKISYEAGGTTFENPNPKLQRCITCDGFGVYFDFNERDYLLCKTYENLKKYMDGD